MYLNYFKDVIDFLFIFMVKKTKLAWKRGSGETRPKTVSGFIKVANFGK